MKAICHGVIHAKPRSCKKRGGRGHSAGTLSDINRQLKAARLRAYSRKLQNAKGFMARIFLQNRIDGGRASVQGTVKAHTLARVTAGAEVGDTIGILR